MNNRIFVLLILSLAAWSCSDASNDARLDPVGDTDDIKITWAKKIGSQDQEEFIHDSVVDSAGNLYITGLYNGTVNFDPNGTAERSAQGGDLFIAKYDSNGNFLWVNTYPSAGFDRGVNLATDAEGVFMLGQMVGSMTFAPNNSLDTGATNRKGLFLLKLNGLGDFLWVKPLAYTTDATGTLNYHIIGKFMRVGQNRIYITGSFENQVDFNPQGTADLRSAVGSKDIFQMKLDGSGNRQWVHTLGGSGYDMGHGVVIKADGGPIFVTHIEGTVDMNPDPAAVNQVTALANPNQEDWATDIVISRYTADGTYINAQSIGGVEDEWIYGVESDSQGNLYLAGLFQGSADFDPSDLVFRLTASAPLPYGYDIFLSKFDASGAHQWTRNFGGTDYQYDWGLSLHINQDDELFLSRCYTGSNSQLNPDNNQQRWQSNGESDVFMSKFLSNGSFQWSKIFGGTAWDCATSITSYGNAIYLSGKISASVTFPDINQTFTATSGNTDAFFLKLEP